MCVTVWSLWKRLLLWVCAATCIAQVTCWSLPRRRAHVTLPSDFPADTPFHRLTPLLDNSDSNSSTIRFSVNKIQVHPNGRVLKKYLVAINPISGQLSLVSKDNLSGGQVRRRWNVTVIISAQMENSTDLTPQKTAVVIFFVGDITSFCRPSHEICFPGNSIKYRLPESLTPGIVFDTLVSFGSLICHNLTTEYRVIKGDQVIAVSPISGSLTVKTDLDAEKERSVDFRIECTMSSEASESPKEFTMNGQIAVIDVNDNPPTTQKGESSDMTEIDSSLITKEGKTFTFHVNVIDKDVSDVNDYQVRIENDPLQLFSVRKIETFQNINAKHLKFNFSLTDAEIKANKPFRFAGYQYNFTIVFEDVALRNHNKVNHFVQVYNYSVHPKPKNQISVKELYEVTLSRNAARHSKVVQPIAVDADDGFRFSLNNSSTDSEGFAITEKTGILYVLDQEALATSSSAFRQFNVTWSQGGNTGRATVLVHLSAEANPPKKCARWCALYDTEESCTAACGSGSVKGHCLWRRSDSPTTLTQNYATCSPDLTSCPDRRCDELEQMDPTICPLDCAKDINGEVERSMRHDLYRAVGPCSCQRISSCTCVRRYEDIHTTRPEQRSKFSPNSDSTWSSDDGSTPVYTDSSTVTKDIFPITGITSTTACGRGCVAFIFLGVCCFVIMCVVILLIRRIKEDQKKKHKYVGSRISLSAVPSDYVDERSSSIPDSRALSESSSSSKALCDAKWEFPRDKLILQDTLGEGEFGKVIKAQAWAIHGSPGYTTVAVKMLKGNGTQTEQHDLMSEFQLLKEICHPNVIRLLGACTQKSGPFFIIVEYAEYGSLRSYLRRGRRLLDPCLPTSDCNGSFHNPSYNPTIREFWRARHRHDQRRELLSYAWQIAKGMAYLSDMKLVHRDLAARNVLLSAGKVAKISDFGLSRDVYEGDTYLKRSKGRVPVKWMAIESLEDHIYTTRSDVWSFGIVLWEIMTQGATPYPGITPERLYHLLKAGYRMKKPENCSESMYQIMRICWREMPYDRPSFKDLVQRLDSLLQDTVDYLELGSVARDDRENSPPTEFDSSDLPQLSGAGAEGEPSGVQYTSLFTPDVSSSAEQSPDSPEHIGLVSLLKLEEQGSSREHNDTAA